MFKWISNNWPFVAMGGSIVVFPYLAMKVLLTSLDRAEPPEPPTAVVSKRGIEPPERMED